MSRAAQLPKDRVAQGEGHRAFPEEELLQEPLHAALVEFDHAATDAGVAARKKADELEIGR